MLTLGICQSSSEKRQPFPSFRARRTKVGVQDTLWVGVLLTVPHFHCDSKVLPLKSKGEPEVNELPHKQKLSFKPWASSMCEGHHWTSPPQKLLKPQQTVPAYQSCTKTFYSPVSSLFSCMPGSAYPLLPSRMLPAYQTWPVIHSGPGQPGELPHHRVGCNPPLPVGEGPFFLNFFPKVYPPLVLSLSPSLFFKVILIDVADSL